MACIVLANTVCSISDMNDWIKALRAAMAQQGVTQEQLAERMGKTQGAVGHWLNGRREPGLADINRMLSELGLPPLSIYAPNNENNNVAPSLQPHRSPQKYPLISWVAAGARAESPDNYCPGDGEEMIESTENAGPHGYWLTVKGHSMKSDGSPSFPDGVKILVQPEGFDVVSGKFYIAKHKDGETTFKQYVRDAGTEYLVPLNQTFKTVEIDGEWRIIGRVVDAKITGL